VKAGPQGRLYGSVTARDIAEALEGPLGYMLEHRQIELEDPIRQVGVFDVPLRLSRNVRATVQVEVLGEGMPPPEVGPSGPAPVAEEEGAEAAVAEGEGTEPTAEEPEAATEEPEAATEEPVAEEAEEPAEE